MILLSITVKLFQVIVLIFMIYMFKYLEFIGKIWIWAYVALDINSVVFVERLFC
jgi:hypothetical protein